MEQHQWTPKSSTEMAPRHHHFHVRVVDWGMDIFRRRHFYTRRFVEQLYHGVLRQQRRYQLPSPWVEGRPYVIGHLAVVVRQHSSRQRQYSTVQSTGLVPSHYPQGISRELTCLPEF
jgi:hypothetical protein